MQFIAIFKLFIFIFSLNVIFKTYWLFKGKQITVYNKNKFIYKLNYFYLPYHGLFMNILKLIMISLIFLK